MYRFKYFPQSYSEDSFRFGKDCRDLAAEIFKASASAPKEYRFTLCKKMHDVCCDLIYSARAANAYPLGSEDRKEEQRRIIELLLRIDDLLPILRRCRCISLTDEAALTKRVGNVKVRFEKWLDSDNYRINKMKHEANKG